MTAELFNEPVWTADIVLRRTGRWSWTDSKTFRRREPWPISKYYPSISLKKWRNPTKTLIKIFDYPDKIRTGCIPILLHYPDPWRY